MVSPMVEAMVLGDGRTIIKLFEGGALRWMMPQMELQQLLVMVIAHCRCVLVFDDRQVLIRIFAAILLEIGIRPGAEIVVPRLLTAL